MTATEIPMSHRLISHEQAEYDAATASARLCHSLWDTAGRPSSGELRADLAYAVSRQNVAYRALIEAR